MQTVHLGGWGEPGQAETYPPKYWLYESLVIEALLYVALWSRNLANETDNSQEIGSCTS
jgi:hypothetical protein